MLRRELLPIAAVVVMAATFSMPAITAQAGQGEQKQAPRINQMSLEGIEQSQVARDAQTAEVSARHEYAGYVFGQAYGAWKAEQARIAEAKAAAARRRQQVQTSSTSVVSGTCAAMKPPGFPDYIIWRESRGNPNARNASGAYGCVQLMPMHLKSGSYAENWARLWDNGNGACHWNPPNYCAG